MADLHEELSSTTQQLQADLAEWQGRCEGLQAELQAQQGHTAQLEQDLKARPTSQQVMHPSTHLSGLQPSIYPFILWIHLAIVSPTVSQLVLSSILPAIHSSTPRQPHQSTYLSNFLSNCPCFHPPSVLVSIRFQLKSWLGHIHRQ